MATRRPSCRRRLASKAILACRLFSALMVLIAASQDDPYDTAATLSQRRARRGQNAPNILKYYKQRKISINSLKDQPEISKTPKNKNEPAALPDGTAI
jgi:hypothetical protein